MLLEPAVLERLTGAIRARLDDGNLDACTATEEVSHFLYLLFRRVPAVR